MLFSTSTTLLGSSSVDGLRYVGQHPLRKWGLRFADAVSHVASARVKARPALVRVLEYLGGLSSPRASKPVRSRTNSKR
jgi:hypothetical protein